MKLAIKKHLVLSALILPVVSNQNAEAHHAFSAEFDRDKPVEVSGKINKVEWMNPHARVYVDVVSEQGITETWNFEMGTPNTLMRNGWRRDSLKPGDPVRVTGWRARNAPLVGNAGKIFQQDGQELFTDSSVRNSERQ